MVNLSTRPGTEKLVRLLPEHQPIYIRYGFTAAFVVLAFAIRVAVGENSGPYAFLIEILNAWFECPGVADGLLTAFTWRGRIKTRVRVVSRQSRKTNGERRTRASPGCLAKPALCETRTAVALVTAGNSQKRSLAATV